MKQPVSKVHDALNIYIKSFEFEHALALARDSANLYGAWDPLLTASHMMLMQSLHARNYLENVLLQTLPPASESLEKTFINQYLPARAALATGSSLQPHIAAYVESSTSWKRLQVHADHQGLIQLLPGDVAIISLQHDEGKRCRFVNHPNHFIGRCCGP